MNIPVFTLKINMHFASVFVFERRKTISKYTMKVPVTPVTIMQAKSNLLVNIFRAKGSSAVHSFGLALPFLDLQSFQCYPR